MRNVECGMRNAELKCKVDPTGRCLMKHASLAVLAAVVLAAAPLRGQSLLYRPPNLGGTWVPDPGVVQFNFVHRFYVADAAGAHKVTNFPTFRSEERRVGK